MNVYAKFGYRELSNIMLSEAFVGQMPLRPINFFNIIFRVFALNGVEMCTKRGQKNQFGLKVDLVKISRVAFLCTFVVEPSTVPGII